MQQKKVFIASTGKAKKIASFLKDEMDNINIKTNHNFWKPIPWFDETSGVRNKLGPSILDNLRAECRTVDLAIILLTEDDLRVKKNLNGKGSYTEMIPRDNCIFEAGLFMGGLGLDPTRCVIVTSVKQETLPDDIRSVHYIKMKNSYTGENDCKNEAKRIATELHSHVFNNLVEPPRRPFLSIYTPEELVDREKPVSQGGDIVDTSGLGVVVNTVQPIETKVSLAKRVIENMDAGIEYYYFFRAEPVRMREVVALIQALIMAKLGEVNDKSENDRIAFIVSKYADSTVFLDAIKMIQRKLFIHFLPIERLPLYFCVHNAIHQSKARCYLRYSGRYPDEPDFFIPWAEKETAYAVANDLLKLRKEENQPAIFYSTEYFDIYSRNKDVSVALKNKIVEESKRQFTDEIHESLIRYFFAP